jgi:flagellar motor switch protein FliN/FliY
MSNDILFNPSLDAKIQDIEKEFSLRAGEVLSSTLNREVKVELLEVLPFDFKKIKGDFPQNTVYIKVPFKTGFEGQNLIVLSSQGAAHLADLMLMGEGTSEFDPDEHLDAVQELFDKVMTDFGSKISPNFDRTVEYKKCKATAIELSPSDFQENNWVLIRFQIDAGEKIDMSRLVTWAAAQEYLSEEEESAMDDGVDDFFGGEESDASYAEDEVNGKQPQELQMLLDIDLPVTIELGRTHMMIKDILKLGPGSIVELDKLSGEPVDLYVNNKKFAQGEVVVIDENFGVRLTEIVQVDERLQSLED